jgi:SAM-dependent methyltransferase
VINRGQRSLPQRWLDSARAGARTLKVKIQSMHYRGLSPRQVFERIYVSGAWGGGKAAEDFNSGTGSADVFTQAYVETVSGYIRAHRIRRIVDLGCGDFRTGRQLIEGEDWDYTGVDIVRPLIAHHNERYATRRVRFLCRDLIDEALPEGDLYLIRQVLQHLDNRQITKIVEKLDRPHVIVTEHLPVGGRTRPNRDKVAGPDIRLYYGSGVFLEHPPFNRNLETLLEVPCPFNGRDAVLRTSRLLPREQ